MNDNDIIKVVEHCAGSGKCIDCPANNYNCTGRLMKCILNLINRLKAENDRLEKESSATFHKWEILDKRTKERYADLYEEAKEVVRAEAIREFAERLKATFPPREDARCTLDDCYTLDCIDNLVKEMTEEAE